MDLCWTNNPPLEPIVKGAPVVTTGPSATHRIACHNPPTAEEAAAGRPLREGFEPAPPPDGYHDELSGTRLGGVIDDETAAELSGDASPYASAGGLPIEADDHTGRHGGHDPGHPLD